MANSYDVVRYPTLPSPETHPASLGAMAAICGRPATSPESCRVLEVGCGDGTNLAAMAVALPRSEFVGIDLAPLPIAVGSGVARAAGLDNLRLLARDITESCADLGAFDYIIAHGVYAWVPGHVRPALWRLASQALTANGLFFVSYNLHPGCRLREALRDIMREAARGIEDPAAILAAAHAALRQNIATWSDDEPFEKALKAEARRVLERPPPLLFHDELSDAYSPQMLSDVARAGAEVGLAYLCDTYAPLLSEAVFPSEKFEETRSFTGGDWVRFEQMADFREMRPFRRSIFARSGAEIDRRFQPSRLVDLHVSATLTQAAPDPGRPGVFSFTTPNDAQFETANAEVGDFMSRVAQASPGTVPMSALAGQPDLLEAIMQLALRAIVALRSTPIAFAALPGPMPVASPLARIQAERGESHLSSLLHRAVRLDDRGARQLLQLLDGTRTHDDIAEAMARVTGGGLDDIRPRAASALRELGKLGLLVS